jgi:hypothetical protein
MLYFEILPDELLLIIFLKSFKDRESLSRVSDELHLNHEGLVSLIKNGNVEPEIWTTKLKNIDIEELFNPYDVNYKITINDININNNDDQFYEKLNKIYEEIISILFIDKNILYVYHKDNVYGSDGYLSIVYKIKSSKELLDLLNNNNIDISKLKSNILFISVNEDHIITNLHKRYIITNIYINSNWNKLWNNNLSNITKNDILELNDLYKF